MASHGNQLVFLTPRFHAIAHLGADMRTGTLGYRCEANIINCRTPLVIIRAATAVAMTAKYWGKFLHDVQLAWIGNNSKCNVSGLDLCRTKR